MCGISGFHLYDSKERPFTRVQMEKFVDELLLGIESRGRDATGVAAILDDGNFQLFKRDTEASSFIKTRPKLPKRPQTVLLHTRYATQGSPKFNKNNHPIVYDDVIVTHNGHINNDDSIFFDEKLKRNAVVDSEAIAALFAKYTIEKAHIPLQKLHGNLAVAVADRRRPGTLVLAKGVGSPLYVYETKQGVVWASTHATISQACREVFGYSPKSTDIKYAIDGDIYYIEDGSMERLKFEPFVPKRTYGGWSGWDDDDEKPLTRTSKSDKIRHSYSRTYKTIVHGVTQVYIRCDECDAYYEDSKLKRIGEWVFCLTCYYGAEDMDEETETIEGEADEVTEENPKAATCDAALADDDKTEKGTELAAVVEEKRQLSMSDLGDREIACRLLGEKYDCKPEFVRWILFTASDDDFDDNPELVKVYVELHDQYYKLMKEFNA